MLEFDIYPEAFDPVDPFDDIRTCRVCGCTDDDCYGCVERTGDACHWVQPDLCSACVPLGEGSRS